MCFRDAILTIVSHVFALSYIDVWIFRIIGFILSSSVLKGLNKLHGNAPDARLPIIFPISLQILRAIPKVINLHSYQLLLLAVFVLTFGAFSFFFFFFFFFANGRDLSSVRRFASQVVQRSDVQFIFEGNRMTCLLLVIKNFENNSDQQPVTLYIPTQQLNTISCPVHNLYLYF